MTDAQSVSMALAQVVDPAQDSAALTRFWKSVD
jgi:hypothetical protein